MNALLSDADTRVLQNPSIRATDGQNGDAEDRLEDPDGDGIVLGGRGDGHYGGHRRADAVHVSRCGREHRYDADIHLDREVSLKLKVEISTQSGSVTISGVTEPIIGQRSDQHGDPVAGRRALPAGRHSDEAGQHDQ